MPNLNPTPIQNQYYKNLKAKNDFIAYRPWGTKPDHHDGNRAFIPIAGMTVTQNDYPQALRKLVDHGWKRAAPNKNPRNNAPVLGAARLSLQPPRPEPPSPLRGFTRDQLVSDWDHTKVFDQVAAYTFRGDSRSVEEVEASDGFVPGFNRTDANFKQAMGEVFANYIERKEGQLDPADKRILERDVVFYLNGLPFLDGQRLVEFTLFREVLKNASWHLRAMTRDPFMKCFISTSRDVAVAADASKGSKAAGGTPVAMGDMGWIYACRVESGFLLLSGTGGIGTDFGEAEIAHPGHLRWKDVYGFRHMTGNLEADRNIYIRRDFYNKDDAAFKQVLGALSSVHTWCLPTFD